MLNAENLTLRYENGSVGLQPVTFNIDAGNLCIITGPSGSGKTSLLKLILGIENPTGGHLSVMGHPMKGIREKDLQDLRCQMGPVFQEFRLIQGRSALENVVLGLRFLKITKEHMYKEAESVLDKVGLFHKRHELVEHMSFGENQRVAIARAVVRKPRLIIADEPTGNLDDVNAKNVLELLASFKTPETSVILATHATHLITVLEPDLRIQMSEGFMTLEEVVR